MIIPCPDFRHTSASITFELKKNSFLSVMCSIIPNTAYLKKKKPDLLELPKEKQKGPFVLFLLSKNLHKFTFTHIFLSKNNRFISPNTMSLGKMKAPSEPKVSPTEQFKEFLKLCVKLLKFKNTIQHDRVLIFSKSFTISKEEETKVTEEHDTNLLLLELIKK